MKRKALKKKRVSVKLTSSNHKNISEKRVLIMAGGTGGHIFPGLAVAKELQKRECNVFWLGSFNGMEEDIISKTDIPLSLISVVGLRGNGLLGWIKSPFLIVKSVISSILVLRKIKPQLVIGFGGFASGPGGLAAYILRIRLVIHEQNAIAGMTNRYLSKLASKVLLGFPNAFGNRDDKKIRVVGNPVREEIKNITKKKKDLSENINILVLGGSRGARKLNKLLPEILDSVKEKNVRIVHQSGKGNQTSTIEEYNKFSCDVEVIEFIESMDKYLSWADVVICRSGASSVSEIAAVGLAAILIPFPFAVDDHQFFNALWLSDNNAAKLIRDNTLDTIESKNIIKNLLKSENKMIDMGIQAKKMAYLNAVESIADECEKSINSTFIKNNLKVA